MGVKVGRISPMKLFRASTICLILGSVLVSSAFTSCKTIRQVKQQQYEEAVEVADLPPHIRAMIQGC